MKTLGYVAPAMDVIEIEIENAVLLNSPTGEGYNNQDSFGGDWN